MKTATIKINEHCRICQEHCWGDCPGAEGLGGPSGKPLSCFRFAETRHGDFDPETGEMIRSIEHEPILLQG